MCPVWSGLCVLGELRMRVTPPPQSPCPVLTEHSCCWLREGPCRHSTRCTEAALSRAYSPHRPVCGPAGAGLAGPPASRPGGPCLRSSAMLAAGPGPHPPQGETSGLTRFGLGVPGDGELPKELGGKLQLSDRAWDWVSWWEDTRSFVLSAALESGKSAPATVLSFSKGQ